MDKYIGQSETYGYWINEVMGGKWEVTGVSRTGGDPKTLPRPYASEVNAGAAAKREIEKDASC